MDISNAKIGWVGLGKMGMPMALNVMEAGFKLTAFDRAAQPLETIVAKGGQSAPSVADLAKTCGVVAATVPDDAVLLAVTLGVGGLFENAPKGMVFIDLSTVSPMASARVAEAAEERGIHYVRAPVSGSTATAAAKQLTVIASGAADVFAAIKPVLESFAAKIYYVGEGDQARYLKLSINLMVGITAAMMGEALALSERGGVDWRTMVDVVNNSAVASPLVGYKAKMLADRDFSPMFSAAQMAKDFDLALDTGRIGNVPMPLTALSRQMFGAMIASGRGDKDFFALVTLLEELAGLTGPAEGAAR